MSDGFSDAFAASELVIARREIRRHCRDLVLGAVTEERLAAAFVRYMAANPHEPMSVAVRGFRRAIRAWQARRAAETDAPSYRDVTDSALEAPESP